MSLTWKKASGATAYEVYMRTGTSGEFTRIATTKKTSYTKSKLRPGKTYYFYIRSVRSAGGTKYYSRKVSRTVKARPMIAALAAPSNFKIYKNANGKFLLFLVKGEKRRLDTHCFSTTVRQRNMKKSPLPSQSMALSPDSLPERPINSSFAPIAR